MQVLTIVCARADNGAVLPGAKVTAYISGTNTKAALFDKNGAPTANPLTANAVGEVQLSAADGLYDVRITSAGGEYSCPLIEKVQIVDLMGIVGTITSGRRGAATWAEISGTTASAGVLTEIPPTDTGTHTDPITSTTVPNTGVFRYTTGSPSGWKRIYDFDGGALAAVQAAEGTALAEISSAKADAVASIVDLPDERGARLKAAVLAAAGGSSNLVCLLTKDGTKTYKSGTTVGEIDTIAPLWPESGVVFGQDATTWNGTGSPVAASALRPVEDATGLKFGRETQFFAKDGSGNKIGLMPSMTGRWAMTFVLRTPATTNYTDVTSMNAALASHPVGSMVYVTGAPGPTAGGAWETVPDDCILSLGVNETIGYWAGGYYTRGNGSFVRVTNTRIASFWDTTGGTTSKVAYLFVDPAGRIGFYVYDGTTQVTDLYARGAGSNFWDLAQAGPVMIEIERDDDEFVLYVNGGEYATFHSFPNFTPNRFQINGMGDPGNATVPVGGLPFTLDALCITKNADYRANLAVQNVLAREFATPIRRWCPYAYAVIVTDQSRFSGPINGSAAAVGTTPSIPDPVSNYAFHLTGRSNVDHALWWPSREQIPDVFAPESTANPNRIGPIRCVPNIYGSIGVGGSRTISGSGAETIEWGIARELQKFREMSGVHLYFFGQMNGGYADEQLKAEDAGEPVMTLADPAATVTQPRSLLNRAILYGARRARKRGQMLRPLLIGNFQGETITYITGNRPSEGALRETDLRNWFGNEIAHMLDMDSPKPIVAAKSIMFSDNATSNSYNTATYYYKDNQFLARQANIDPMFRYICFGSTGNWMGRAIHFEAVQLRHYGMIIGDRIGRAYFRNEKAEAMQVTWSIGTGGDAGKLVGTVKRRLVVDAGGTPMMPGLYKSDGLNGSGYLTYGLVFTPTSGGRTISGDVTLTLGTNSTTIKVPISGGGSIAGDAIDVTGTGALYSNLREETTRIGYYKTQAWGTLPLSNSTPLIDYSADAILSDYLAPSHTVMGA